MIFEQKIGAPLAIRPGGKRVKVQTPSSKQKVAKSIQPYQDQRGRLTRGHTVFPTFLLLLQPVSYQYIRLGNCYLKVYATRLDQAFALIIISMKKQIM